MTESLRTDMNAFLFTPIASDDNGMHLTMLSALARTGVDPWAEAAGLAALSRENAMQKLELLLSAVPNGPLPGDATTTLAAQLVTQLHASPKPLRRPTSPPPGEASDGHSPLPSFASLPKRVKWTIYSLVALVFIIVVHRAFSGEMATPGDTSHLQQASD